MQQAIGSKNSIAGMVIAFLCIIVYLVILVSSALRIVSSIDRRRDHALEEFEYIVQVAADRGTQGFMDERFIAAINTTLANSQTIEALIVTGPNGAYAFEKEQGKSVSWVNNAPRFRERLDFSRQPLYRPLRIQNVRNANIEGRSGALDYAALSEILKQSLLLILLPLLAACFTLLLESLMGGGRTEPVQPQYAGRPKQLGLDASRFETQAETAAGSDISGSYRGGATGGASGGAGWEEYTASRLDTESRRCTAEGHDIVVITAKTGITDESFYSRFVAEASAFFALPELIFEKGERGVTVIYPEINLETAFEKARGFRRRLSEKYPLAMKARNALCIGLSSRAGRTIDAERMLFEADEALLRASRDPVSPIVAFKSDPEKYEEFINRNK